MKFDSLIQKIGGTTHFLGRKEGSAAPTLVEAVRIPSGPFRFKTRLPKETTYQAQACTDLRTWQTIGSGKASETVEYVDSDAFKFSHRFYRLIADTVYSANVIGYVSVMLPPGYSMIANPLEGSGNSVGDLFKAWPDSTSLSRFDTRLFKLAENIIKFGKWTNPGERLQPGEGAIFFNPTTDYKSVSFVGEVLRGNLSVPIPAGFSVRSSLAPQPGNLEDLGFPIANGDVIHLFDRDRQQYVLYPYEEGRWTAGTPELSVGESFWVAKKEPGNWICRTLIGANQR